MKTYDWSGEGEVALAVPCPDEKPRLAGSSVVCSLALAADLIVAAESAYFLLAFVNIGLGLDGGASLTLPLRAGHARAFEMAFLGERIPASTALEWELVSRVVSDDELEAAVSALGDRLRAASPGALATIKRTVNHRLYDGFEELLKARGGAPAGARGVGRFLGSRDGLHRGPPSPVRGDLKRWDGAP
jgi:2-(1,2-epoxy-1,2-dihydrophenyl)acetyl-CoA isomerase